MKIKLKIDDQETRAVWETAQRAKAEVESWPAWKRGEETNAANIDGTTEQSSTTPSENG